MCRYFVSIIHYRQYIQSEAWESVNMSRNISEQDKRVSSHLSIYQISENGKNTCICEYGRICYARQSWKNPNSPKQVIGASRAFACRQTSRREQWSHRQCVRTHGESQLDLTSPFKYALCCYFLPPSNAVKSLSRSGNGWWPAEKQEWKHRFRQEASAEKPDGSVPVS